MLDIAVVLTGAWAIFMLGAEFGAQTAYRSLGYGSEPAFMRADAYNIARAWFHH